MSFVAKDELRNQVACQISAHISKTFGEAVLQPLECFTLLTEAPNLSLGHMAFPCFTLAKACKKSPKAIAEELAAKWPSSDLVKKTTAVGPYLNFFFSSASLGNLVLKDAVNGNFFRVPDNKEAPYLIEYSQPNTHKELHVGHMRNLCFGQALINIIKYTGNPVVTCTFPGDVGTHVAKCLWYLKNKNTEKPPEINKGEWLGRMYTAAHNLLEDEKGSEKEDQNRSELTEILRQIEKGEGEYFALWQETRKWSIELMNKVYAWAGVEFDRWFWESEVDSPSVKLVKKLFEEGKLQESQGAVGYDLEAEKLGFCLMLKSDGNGLYATKDLELARRKFEEYKPKKNIVIVDLRQELHFKQVFTVFEKVGLGKTEDCLHLKYNFVELPDGAMSSRKGNIVPITDLIEQMKNTITKNYLERYRGDWPDEEIAQTADSVAQGAIKYGMNKMDTAKKIVFDMREWLRLDGDSGPYIQYTNARIQSLCKKQGYDPETKVDWSKLTVDSELALMIQISRFQEVLFKSAEGFRTSTVCTYLYDLSKTFNTFYQECPIGKVEDKALKAARLGLSQAVAKTLQKGLEIIGIPSPQRM